MKTQAPKPPSPKPPLPPPASLPLPRALLIIIASMCSLATVAGQTAGQSAGQTVQSRIDWQTGILSFSIEAAQVDREFNRPTSFYRAEKTLQERADEIAFDIIMDIQIDSYNTFSDLARRDLRLLRRAGDIIDKLYMTTVIPDPQQDSILSHFALDLYPALTGELVRHNTPFPMADVLEWQPGSEYTGLVIYAQRPLPVHGEERMATLEPALFPVIYDRNLRRIVDRNSMDPEYARLWGAAAYARNADEHSERVGDNPLRIIALGIFGIAPTDPVISVADADILLHNSLSRKNLQEGRIVIIISEAADQ